MNFEMIGAWNIETHLFQLLNFFSITKGFFAQMYH